MSSHSAHSHCPKGSSSMEYHPASQNLFYFADFEYPVVCFVLNVYGVDDGASRVNGLGLLAGVVDWTRLPHSEGMKR